MGGGIIISGGGEIFSAEVTFFREGLAIFWWVGLRFFRVGLGINWEAGLTFFREGVAIFLGGVEIFSGGRVEIFSEGLRLYPGRVEIFFGGGGELQNIKGVEKCSRCV